MSDFSSLPRFTETAKRRREVQDDATVLVSTTGRDDASDAWEHVLPSRQEGPLMHAAWPSLLILTHIKAGWVPDDITAFKNRLTEIIREFSRQADATGCPAESIACARYLLCTALDEAVVLTAWGQGGVWSERSLLSLFHNQTWGGDASFRIVDYAQDNKLRDVLAIAFEILVLGFQGRLRTEKDGTEKADLLAEKLFHVLYDDRGEGVRSFAPKALSAGKPQRMMRLPAVKTVGLICLVLLLVAMVGRGLQLAQRDAQMRGDLDSLNHVLLNEAQP